MVTTSLDILYQELCLPTQGVEVQVFFAGGQIHQCTEASLDVHTSMVQGLLRLLSQEHSCTSSKGLRQIWDLMTDSEKLPPSWSDSQKLRGSCSKFFGSLPHQK